VSQDDYNTFKDDYNTFKDELSSNIRFTNNMIECAKDKGLNDWSYNYCSDNIKALFPKKE